MNRIAGAIAGTTLTAGLLGTTFAPAALAAGTTQLSRDQVSRIVLDTAPGQPAKCYIAGRADSDRAWAILTYRSPAPKGCQPTDGYWVVHRTSSGWIDTEIPVVVTTCKNLRKDLAKAGAPLSVFSDFKTSGACQSN